MSEYLPFQWREGCHSCVVPGFGKYLITESRRGFDLYWIKEGKNERVLVGSYDTKLFVSSVILLNLRKLKWKIYKRNARVAVRGLIRYRINLVARDWVLSDGLEQIGTYDDIAYAKRAAVEFNFLVG